MELKIKDFAIMLLGVFLFNGLLTFIGIELTPFVIFVEWIMLFAILIFHFSRKEQSRLKILNKRCDPVEFLRVTEKALVSNRKNSFMLF